MIGKIRFKKVFILTEGGCGLGFGHIARCVSLVQAFQEYQIKPRLIVNGDKSIKCLFRNEDYEMFNWLKEKNKILKIVKDAGIVVVDSYIAGISFYNNLSKSVSLLVCIDDFNRLKYPDKSVVINTNIYAQKIRYFKNNTNQYILGTEYVFLNKVFWRVPVKTIRKSLNKVMISFGGSDIKEMTPKILDFFVKNYPRLTKNVCLSRGFRNTNLKQTEALKDRKTNLIYYPKAKDIKAVMLDSDIAVSAGGQSLYEFARIGVPTIGVCVAKNQLNNLKSWQRTGFIAYAGWHNGKNLFTNIEKILMVLDYKKRVKMSKIGQRYVNGKGAKRMVREVLNWMTKDQ